MAVTIRPETPLDDDAIAVVTAAAFAAAPYASHTEHAITAALRRAGQLTISLVADDSGAVVGHVAVSPVAVSSGAADWYGLGPIAVAPERHRQGIGTLLMERALAELERRDAAGCVILGDPAFYNRFGFYARPGLTLPGVDPYYFMARAFRGSVPAGTVAYHAAFDTEVE